MYIYLLILVHSYCVMLVVTLQCALDAITSTRRVKTCALSIMTGVSILHLAHQSHEVGMGMYIIISTNNVCGLHLEGWESEHMIMYSVHTCTIIS